MVAFIGSRECRRAMSQLLRYSIPRADLSTHCEITSCTLYVESVKQISTICDLSFSVITYKPRQHKRRGTYKPRDLDLWPVNLSKCASWGGNINTQLEDSIWGHPIHQLYRISCPSFVKPGDRNLGQFNLKMLWLTAVIETCLSNMNFLRFSDAEPSEAGRNLWDLHTPVEKDVVLQPRSASVLNCRKWWGD